MEAKAGDEQGFKTLGAGDAAEIHFHALRTVRKEIWIDAGQGSVRRLFILHGIPGNTKDDGWAGQHGGLCVRKEGHG